MDLDFENDIAIDPGILDEEWLSQAGLYMRYGAQSALWKKKRDKIWERLKSTRSQLIKESGGKNADERESYFRNHPEYIAIKNDMIEADYNLDMVNHAVFAMQNRKTALENLVRLYLGEYYSTPREPKQMLKEGKRIIDMKRDRISQEKRKASTERQRSSRRKK